MTGRRELFVWYRVRRERAEDARRVVAAFQRTLVDRWPDLIARLLVRGDGETATWMETYARLPDIDAGGAGVDVEIERAIAAVAQPLAPLIEGGRHSEAFELVR